MTENRADSQRATWAYIVLALVIATSLFGAGSRQFALSTLPAAVALGLATGVLLLVPIRRGPERILLASALFVAGALDVYLITTVVLQSEDAVAQLYSVSNAAHVFKLVLYVGVFGSVCAGLRGQLRHGAKAARVIEETTQHLLPASRQIATASSQQFECLTATTTSLREISVSATELKATVQEFADRSRSVREAANETATQAGEGRAAAQESAQQTELARDSTRAAAEMVLDLAEQMQKITDITDTVNELAEQTKLLALNASIEAARAGEEGKGFAVVATQVRELANQSKQAANRISSLIGETQRSLQEVVSRIERGSRQTDETAEMVQAMAERFASLTTAFAQTAEAMKQISIAATQQETGIGELASALADAEENSKRSVESTEVARDALTGVESQIAQLKTALDHD